MKARKKREHDERSFDRCDGVTRIRTLPETSVKSYNSDGELMFNMYFVTKLLINFDSIFRSARNIDVSRFILLGFFFYYVESSIYAST